MADQTTSETLSPEVVGRAFVEDYYSLHALKPELAHSLYLDSSVVVWPGPDGEIVTATGLKEIADMIQSSDHDKYSIKISTIDAQSTFTEGYHVLVTGYYIRNENLKRISFSQSFVLAPNGKSIYVMNDILRFVDISECSTEAAASDDVQEKASDVPLNHVCSDVADLPSENSASTESRPVNDSAKIVPEESINKVDVAEVVTKPPVPPSPLKTSVTKEASNVKDDSHKITYASMLVKGSSAATPPTHGPSQKIVRVSANAGQKANPTPKPSAPADAQKAQPVTSNGVSRVSTPPSNDAPENTNVQAVRGIYLKPLPDVSKTLLRDVFKKFGKIKFDGIQIKKYEDGFRCGFVEFDNPDSARNAVEVGALEIEGKEVYISYKKSEVKGNYSSRRYPSDRSGVSHNGNFRTEQDGGYHSGKQTSNGGQSEGAVGHNGDHWRNNRRRDERIAGQGKVFDGRRNGEAAQSNNH